MVEAVRGVPAPPQRAVPSLVANFLPVRFHGQAFHAGVVPFDSRERLDGLRIELQGTHVVAREGDQIVCVPLTADSRPVGTEKKFPISDFRHLTMRLVREALINEIIGMGYKLRSFKQPGFVSRYRQQDLLAQCAGDQREALAGVHVFPQYRLDARANGPSARMGIVVGLKTRYEFDLTVQDLLDRGFRVEGRYVLAQTGEVPYNPHLDECAYRKLVGAVESVRAGRLHLRDAPAVSEVGAGEAWLEGRLDTFQDVVAFLTGGRQGPLLERLEEEAFALTGAEGRLGRITSLARRLARGGPLRIAADVEVEIGVPLGTGSTGSSGGQVRSTPFAEPTFVFDPGGGKTDKSAQRGLTRLGPFDSESFSPRRPRILVMTPRPYQGSVEVFMNQFRRGVPNAKVFTEGFARKYRLTDCDIRIEAFEATGPRDATAYRDACLAALDRDEKPHLAIVITSEAQQDLQGDDSPYLVAKSTLMGQGVPVQEIQYETIGRGDVAYPLDSMALQCYAKLGGIPFVIAAPGTIMHELVIGIGSAHIKPSRFSAPERVVGITTVFSADGNYLLSNMSREADYDRYPAELLRALRVCIDEVKTRNAWRPDDAIRLIFHVFKPLKDTEADAVKDLVSGLLAEFRAVQFAFVHVSDEHDWYLFDTAAQGVGNAAMPSGRRQPKGRYVPQRGHAVTISSCEVLLTVSGPYDIKRPTHGLPRPLLLKLHRASTFTDIEYLAGQAFRFTALSWRRFYPSRSPVTIMYSDLIASLLGQLRHVRNWNADILRTAFRTSRWFL